MLFILFAQAAVAVVASGGSAAVGTRCLGPLVCAHPSCPTFAGGGRAVNNSNFHLRGVAITAGPGGWFYLTGTSNSAGDSFWTDVWGTVRVWRSRTPLVAGSFIGGSVVFNLTRDCKFCGPATAAGGCRAPNSCAQCGVRNDSADGGCTVCHKRSERESARRVSLKIDDTTRPVQNPDDDTSKQLTVQVCPRLSTSTAGGAAIVSSTIAAAAIVRDHLQQHPGSRAEVVLCAGRHPLTGRLVLGPQDSGSESEPVRWRSDGDGMAVLDAGFRVSGWRQSSGSAGIWEASLPPGMESRQLWVNGKRAVRARSTSGAVILGTITESGYSNAHCVDENSACSGWGASHHWSCPGPHVGYWHGIANFTACQDKCCAIKGCTAAMYFTETSEDCYALARPVSAKTCTVNAGLGVQTAVRSVHPGPQPPPPLPACPKRSLGDWLSAGAEFVYQPSGATWTEPRCRVESVETASNGSVTIEMGQPCFTVARGKFQGQEVTFPAYVENAKALLGTSGEWFADFTAAKAVIYYKPLPGEAMNTLDAVLGTVPAHSHDTGGFASAAITLSDGAHHISFQGLMITHLTWLRPSSRYGFVDLNFGFYFAHETAQHANVPHSLHGVPGAIQISGAHNINITNSSFDRLGLTGVVSDAGSQNIRVENCDFQDISGNAILLGNVSEPNLPLAQQDRQLSVTNNDLSNLAVEFGGCSGIFAGYVSELMISHNTISNTSNGAICTGYGWGGKNSMTSNRITYNHIVRSNTALVDCGSIYTLSEQTDSEISFNYIEDQQKLYGSLYHDSRSSGFHTHHNVVSGGPMWLYLQIGALGGVDNVLVESNWHDQKIAGGCALPSLSSTCSCNPPAGVAERYPCGNVTLSENVLVDGANWPPAARVIMAAAGKQTNIGTSVLKTEDDAAPPIVSRWSRGTYTKLSVNQQNFVRLGTRALQACITKAPRIVAKMEVTAKTDDDTIQTGDGADAAAQQRRRPAILFCTFGGWVDKLYMRHVHSLGFEVDFSTPTGSGAGSLADCNATRLRGFNVAVFFATPGSVSQCLQPPGSPSCDLVVADEFAAVVEEFVADGGGVLLMPPEQNIGRQRLFGLTELFGIKLPWDLLTETNESNTATMTHIPSAPLAFTDNITTHAITEGVGGLWYPVSHSYNGQHTGPLLAADASWQVVVHATSTTTTSPITASAYSPVFEPTLLPNGTVAPALVAVRDYKKGRVVCINSWFQYTLGSNSNDWLYADQVMRNGSMVDGHRRRSDFGVMFDQIWTWLSAPSVSSGTLGGYVQPPGHLTWENELASTKDAYNETSHAFTELELERDPSEWPSQKVFHGVIGLRTTYGSGHSTVEEYAAEAAKLGLAWLVFLDEYHLLSNSSYAALKADCKTFSTDTLKLWPGYTMWNNVGNHMMLYAKPNSFSTRASLACFFSLPVSKLTRFVCTRRYGPDPPLPPADLMRPGDCKCGGFSDCPSFELQPQWAANCSFKGELGPSFHWMLAPPEQPDNAETHTVGYFNITSSPLSMQMPDMRGYSSAAVMYYSNLELVEDNTEQYLLTAEGTLAPCPISFNEVRSVDELRYTLAHGHSITHVRAGSLDQLWDDGLRWDNQFDFMPVHVAPLGLEVRAWGHTSLRSSPVDPASSSDTSYGAPNRAMTLGAARFVTNRAVSPVAVSVASSPNGLRTVDVYDGTRLYRRFGPMHSPNEFYRTLLLNGVVQRNLILVATDTAGNKAITYAFRQWKDSGFHRDPVFCSDHVNDCNGKPLLNRGAETPSITWVEPIPLDQQGRSWDGGNGKEVGVMLLTFETQRPTLTTVDGLVESGARFTGVPKLEYSDEGCVATSDDQDKLYDARIAHVENGWNTWGPFQGPSRLFRFTGRYRLWFPATTGWPKTGWPALPEAAGIAPSLWRLDMTMKRSLSVGTLELWTAAANTNVALSLVHGQNLSDEGRVLAVSKNTTETNLTLHPQGWFYLVSPNQSATQMFYIQGNHSVQLLVRSDGFITCVAAGLGQLKADAQLSFEMLSFGIGMRTDLTQVAQVRALQEYLSSPTVLEPNNASSRVGYRPSYAKRVERSRPLLEYTVGTPGPNVNDQTYLELMLPKPASLDPIGVVVPLRVCGLVRRWSVGLFQRQGYALSTYYNGTGENRFTTLGLDFDACAHAPLYVDLAEMTSVVVGHPVIITSGNNVSLWTSVFIEVVKISDTSNSSWVVTANNPTSTDLSVTMQPLWNMRGFPIPKEGMRVLLPALSAVTVTRSDAAPPMASWLKTDAKGRNGR